MTDDTTFWVTAASHVSMCSSQTTCCSSQYQWKDAGLTLHMTTPRRRTYFVLQRQPGLSICFRLRIVHRC